MITYKNNKARTNKNDNSETNSAGVVTSCIMVEGYTDVSEERTASIFMVEE
jgi:hypothetical protein